MNNTLCNMCMIEDTSTGRILVQHRLPKATNPWCWLTFPGGHVEQGESIMASTVREIREETGLTVSNLRMCGVVEWETIGARTAGSPAEVEANSNTSSSCSAPAHSLANSNPPPRGGWSG